MSKTEGPMVPSEIGKEFSLSPTTNFPDLMLAPVFASMIRALGCVARRTALPLERWDGCFGTPAGGGSVLRSSSQCALQDVAPRLQNASERLWIMWGSRWPAAGFPAVPPPSTCGPRYRRKPDPAA